MLDTAVLAAQHLEVLTHVLQCLGFIINTEKSVMTPTQELEFLDTIVNSNTLLVSLLADKFRQRQSEYPTWPLCQPDFFGKLSAATQAIPSAPLFYRCLQRDLQVALVDSDQNYETFLSLSQASQEELSWWKEHISRWNGKPLKQEPEQVSDASQLGWGAACAETCTEGAWSLQALQLPGVASSHICSEDLPEGCFRDFNTHSAGQCHSSGMHQQCINNMGGTADRTGEGPMDVGSRQGHYPISPTYFGCVQHDSRQGILDNTGRHSWLPLPCRLPYKGNLKAYNTQLSFVNTFQVLMKWASLPATFNSNSILVGKTKPMLFALHNIGLTAIIDCVTTIIFCVYGTVSSHFFGGSSLPW